MRFKKYIPIGIYLLLIVGCFLIVRLAGRLAEPDKDQGEEPSVSLEAVNPETEPKQPEKQEPPSEEESETETWPELSFAGQDHLSYEKEDQEEETKAEEEA